MGFFDGMSNVQSRDGSNRLTPGVYPDLEIGECKVVQGHHGVRFIVALTPVTEPSERELGVTPTPVGSEASWSARLDGPYPDIGKGEVKAFVREALGLTKAEETQIDEAKMESIIGPAQILKGRRISTTAWNHQTKGGHTIVKHSWGQAQGGAAAAPTVPAAPPPPVPAPVPAAFPPAGWAQHPTNPTYYFKGQEVLTEAQLRAR